MNHVKTNRDDIKEQITYCVLNAISGETDPSDEKLREIISDVISENTSYKMNLDQKREMAQSVFNSLRRLDVIEPLMEDPSITEIMVNGPYKIFFERGGKLYRSDLAFRDEESLRTCISCFFANQNRPLNEANPIADLRLPDGSRANAVLPPISRETTVTIRKFTGITHDIVSLIRQEFISEEAARFLAECVRNKRTIFICGGTGSGKTTFLNSLSNFIPKDERIVTIEDSAELNLQGIDNLVRMEARLPGPDGTGEINIGMMIRASLRMRPDRIIVGEVRETVHYGISVLNRNLNSIGTFLIRGTGSISQHIGITPRVVVVGGESAELIHHRESQSYHTSGFRLRSFATALSGDHDIVDIQNELICHVEVTDCEVTFSLELAKVKGILRHDTGGGDSRTYLLEVRNTIVGIYANKYTKLLLSPIVILAASP